jgi:hypothetical protein
MLTHCFPKTLERDYVIEGLQKPLWRPSDDRTRMCSNDKLFVGASKGGLFLIPGLRDRLAMSMGTQRGATFMHSTTILCVVVLVSIALVAPVSAEFKEILNIDCEGSAHAFVDTPVQMSLVWKHLPVSSPPLDPITI